MHPFGRFLAVLDQGASANDDAPLATRRAPAADRRGDAAGLARVGSPRGHDGPSHDGPPGRPARAVGAIRRPAGGPPGLSTGAGVWVASRGTTIRVVFAISSPTLVDRVADLERLQAAWRAVVDGRPRLVLLAGEAGIGKSRLLREFAADVVATGGRSMTGACMQLGEVPLAFLPVAEIVRRLARSGDPAALAALDPARMELAALVPSLADGLPGSRQARGTRGEPADAGRARRPGRRPRHSRSERAGGALAAVRGDPRAAWRA